MALQFNWKGGDHIALDYEFVKQVKPRVWKVYRKSDRVNFLAQDLTQDFFRDAGGAGEVATSGLADLYAFDMVEPLKLILNHPNLVSLRDAMTMDFSTTGSFTREHVFFIWDYCDAGLLSNLLFPPSSNTQETETTSEDGSEVELEDPTFLPESFVWHVLCSVLQALAWMHDGVKEYMAEGEKLPLELSESAFSDILNDIQSLPFMPTDPDWSPILHRNITPENIFLSYPRRDEWYGPCKLGNFTKAWISGHVQHPSSEGLGTEECEVITPDPDSPRPLPGLAELIRDHQMKGALYPRQRNQPYTMVSEYRALGEVTQAMMVRPLGENHMRRIRSNSARESLKDLGYSHSLKNFVIQLMEWDPWGPKLDFDLDVAPPYTTSKYMAFARYRRFNFLNSGGDEGSGWKLQENGEDDQLDEDLQERRDEFMSLLETQRVLETV
ncbi:hypothetical protein F5Y15DRAFT_418324 [Xylariaceae sp. FL0016]|nr:hypothetical protein F5Y15DRAFT_418324 [Xylariaceae sp. FL0016]